MSFPAPYLGYSDAKYHRLTLAADGVLLLTFDRPPVNSWIEAKWQELAQILRKVRDDLNVSAIVVAGEGRCFTAGLDINETSLPEAYTEASDAARKALAMRAHVRDFQEAISWFEYVEKPVIAAVHGVAFGLAIDIMSACDIRYSTHDARFSIKEVDVGLAADIGTLQRFPKIVGNDSLARELCYTAREFGAAEAREIGFLSKIVQGGRDQAVGKYIISTLSLSWQITWEAGANANESHSFLPRVINNTAEAVSTASIIASKAPVAVRATKIFLLHSRDHR